jgi:hypothetical protein
VKYQEYEEKELAPVQRPNQELVTDKKKYNEAWKTSKAGAAFQNHSPFLQIKVRMTK